MKRGSFARAAGRRRFTRLSHHEPPGGHQPLPSPLPVADGRAQPKDRAGSETHHQPPSTGLEKTPPPATRLAEERTEKQDRVPTVAPPEEAGSSAAEPSRGETRAGGSGLREAEAPPSSLHPRHPQTFNPITVPQTPERDKQSHEEKFGISWTRSVQEDAQYRAAGRTFICVVCIYCLHNDATFRGYRNVYEFQV